MLVGARSANAAAPSREGPLDPSHQVHFYEDTADLVEIVGEFLIDGLQVGEPVLVVATEAHREALRRRLSNADFDVEHLEDAGVVTMVDAHAMLARLTIRGRPNEVLFQSHIGTLLEERAGLGPHGRVRVYGEMVDLLFQADQSGAAVRLEEMWNALQQRQAFSLLCAYAARGFDNEADLRRACATHTHVVSRDARDRADGCAPYDVDLRPDQMRAIVAEIAVRKQVEGELRTTVRQLEIAKAERAELLAGLGHELCGPLASILAALDTLDRTLDGAAAEERAILQRQARHLARLVDELLARDAAGAVHGARPRG